MPQVRFTSFMERFVDCPAVRPQGTTVRSVLEEMFQENPNLRGYLLDDQGRLRQHVVIFVNGVQLRDRERLSDEVGDDDEIFVMQALSGG